MKYRTLGKTGFSVSDVGFGAWGIGGAQWQGGTDDESVRALHRAIDLGINFIDTALAYGDGHSEKAGGPRGARGEKENLYRHQGPSLEPGWPAKPGIGIEKVFPYEYICAAPKPVSSI